MSTRAEKLRNAAARLNGDRAKMPEAYKYKRGKIVGFFPCEKALVFLAAMCPPKGYRADALRMPGYADISTESVLSVVELRASMMQCACHPQASANDLMEMEYLK